MQYAMHQGSNEQQETALAVLLGCDEKTVRSDIRWMRGELGIVVPARGTKKDIGPGVTHRGKVLELYLRGEEEVAS